MNKLVPALVLAVALASGVSGCAVTRGHETVGEYVDDATISSRVKTRFAKDPSVSAMRIHVDTDKGVVSLSGTAKSSSERQQAESIAVGVPGVQSVQNNITVDSTTSDTTNR
jgi:hyperosmotically inducible periplasmic protein